MVQCPECDGEFPSTQSFCAHWGQMHDGPTPEEIDTSRSEDTRRKMSEATREQWADEDRRQRLSESMANLMAHGEHAGTSLRQVIATRNVVRSSWEEEIDVLLHEAGVEYGYEVTTYHLATRSYTPDFETPDAVIEVKGGPPVDGARELEFLHFTDKRFIVVGRDVPCDVHIPWSDRETLLEYL